MEIEMSWSRYVWVIVVASVVGCAGPQASVHEAIKGSTREQLPRKVLLLPPDIRVHELSVGDVAEKVDDWTRAANQSAVEVAREMESSGQHFDIVDVPPLSADDKVLLEQYTALYELVAGNAYVAQKSPFPAWQERARSFDYTLGPGLAPLREHTHADGALFIVGNDYISTAGRKAAMVMGILAGGATGVYLGPHGAPTFLSVGVVDLQTGNLIWFATDFHVGNRDLRNKSDVAGMLRELFTKYPSGTQKADAPR
jgi:hypothetical protein